MSQGTIFIVDDTPANLGILFKALEKVGFQVLVDTNGESAVQTISQVRPDLILLDILMPGIDGFEVCRSLKAQAATRDIPIIFMTALAEPVDEVKGLKLGAVDYITKPFQLETVLARVQTHLTLRDAQKRLQAQNLRLQQEILERQHAEHTLQQRNRSLFLLNQLSHKFNSSLELEQVLEIALGEIQRLLAPFSTSFWLLAPETGELVCMHAKGPGSERLLHWRLAPGQGLTGWAIAHGETLLVSDTWADARHFKEIDAQTGVIVRSLISIPLQVKKTIIGVLNLVDPRIAYFTHNDVIFLEPIAAAAAIAIENARLYASAQQELAERKQAEAALRDSEERYRRLVEASPIPILVHSEEKFVFLNPEAIRALKGKTPADFLGQSIWDVVHPDFQRIIHQRVQKLYAKTEPAKLLYEKFIRRDGKVIDVEAMASITDYHGKPASQVVFRDVTELKQVQEALQKSQELLHKIFISLEEVVLVIEAETNMIILCNPAVERIFGYREQEVCGETPAFLYSDPEIYEFFREDLFHALDAKEVFHAESSMRRKDGSLFLSEHTAMELSDYAGRRTGVVWTIREITERKRAEKALAEERNLLRVLIDNLPDLIYVKDAQSRFLLANQATARSLAVPDQDELAGKTDFDFHAPDMAETYYADELAVIASGQPLINREERILDQETGATRWLLSTKVPFRDIQGNLAGLVGINRDVTELKQAENKLLAAHKELKEKNAQLAELNASKDKFFSIISHDLKSPFTVILGYSQVIAENFEALGKEEIATLIGSLRTSIEKLYALLENLLTWARVQQGAIAYAPEELDLSSLAEENIDLFLTKAAQKAITLYSSIVPPIAAYADVNMVNTVLRNLISNALKFTPVDGRIELSARITEPFVEIAVADTGIGISPEDLPKLFRIDAHYTNVGLTGEKGTGLGLSLCKDLVEKNGGQIRVESNVGQGTTFRFTLPQKANPSP